MHRRQQCGGAGRHCVAACPWQPIAGLSCCPRKPRVEFLLFFPFEGKNKPASLERIEKMGSDSHNNGKAGRVKQAQSDLEQHQDHSKLFKLLINCRSSHPGMPPKPSRVQRVAVGFPVWWRHRNTCVRASLWHKPRTPVTCFGHAGLPWHSGGEGDMGVYWNSFVPAGGTKKIRRKRKRKKKEKVERWGDYNMFVIGHRTEKIQHEALSSSGVPQQNCRQVFYFIRKISI